MTKLYINFSGFLSIFSFSIFWRGAGGTKKYCTSRGIKHKKVSELMIRVCMRKWTSNRIRFQVCQAKPYTGSYRSILILWDSSIYSSLCVFLLYSFFVTDIIFFQSKLWRSCNYFMYVFFNPERLNLM